MYKIIFFLFLSHLLLPALPAYLFIQGAENHVSIYIIISRVAGIYAFVWYSMQFTLTTRIRLLERIYALDKRIILHMIFSLCTLAVVLIHTTFGNERAASELQAGFGGTADTVFLYAVLFSSLFFSNYFIRFVPYLIPYRDKISSRLRLTYERCQILHYAMPIGMLIVIFHIILLPGNNLIAFKICMTTISCIGLSVFFIHKFYIPKSAYKDPWNVNGIIEESETITTLSFEHSKGKQLKHSAGQFCYIRPIDETIPDQFHPFTISSGSRDNHPSITFKNVGDFTAQLKNIRTGVPVAIIGPYGQLSYSHVPSRHALVFIAGGIGITPMLSMLKDISEDDPDRKILLIWNVRFTSDFIRYEEIKSMGQQMRNFIFEPIVSGENQWEGRKGRISEALLTELFKIHEFYSINTQYSKTAFFICGPPLMTTTVCIALKKIGVKKVQIHTERFAF